MGRLAAPAEHTSAPARRGRLRFGGADPSDEQKLADLENTLRLIGLDAAEYAPLLAPLFDVPLPEDRAAKFAPEELRRRQLAAMTALFLAGARSQPVVLAFEDLHWADPTSLDLLRALVERGAQAPLLIVATTRPEFRPDWSLRSHHSVISLAPLDRAQVAEMVAELSARHALPKEIVEGVSERTGGVPLFVEEVTRLLLERGALFSIGFTAKFCCGWIRPIRQPSRKPSELRSLSRDSRAHAVTNCSHRFPLPSFTNRPPAPPTPMPFSRRRSKAFRRRPKCPRSPRRRRCSRDLH